VKVPPMSMLREWVSSVMWFYSRCQNVLRIVATVSCHRIYHNTEISQGFSPM
jgi:hypothetical protein